MITLVPDGVLLMLTAPVCGAAGAAVVVTGITGTARTGTKLMAGVAVVVAGAMGDARTKEGRARRTTKKMRRRRKTGFSQDTYVK